MDGFSVKKVPGGKLIKIRLNFSEKIDSIKLMGDFFLHPEDTVLELEKTLIGLNANESLEFYSSKLENVLHLNNAELFGISSNDLAETLMEAIKNGLASNKT